MIKKYRNVIIVAVIPLIIAAVLYGICDIWQNAEGYATAPRTFIKTVNIIGLVVLLLTLIAAGVKCFRAELLRLSWKVLGYIAYTDVCLIIISSMLKDFISPITPLSGFVDIFRVIYIVMFVMLMTIYVVCRVQARKIDAEVAARTQRYKDFTDRCGSNKKLEAQYIYADLDERAFDRFISILCGVKPSALRVETGNGSDSFSWQTELEKRGLLLGDSILAARHPEQLRMLFDRLCENRRLKVRISQKELADEMALCDDELIRQRRREGASTWDHDVNLITHILERSGHTIVFFDTDQFAEMSGYAVIEKKKLPQLQKFNDM